MSDGRIPMRARVIHVMRTVFLAAAALVFAAGAAYAQLPTIRFGATEPFAFEGTPGGRPVTLDFVVELSAVSTQRVTALFSTGEFGGVTRSVSGDTCAPGIDFIRVVDQLVTIDANVNPPQAIVSVTVCPDTQVEITEALNAVLTDPVNAVCDGSGCATRATIGDDDGPPNAVGNAVSVREPATGSKTATFTVTLSHPHPAFEVRVNWVTRDGTAIARPGACGFVSPGGGFPDYLGGSGTLIFPSGERSKTLGVTICADSVEEPTETFFVDLTGGTNVNLGALGDGFGSILDFRRLSIGDFVLTPDAGEVQANEWLDYRFTWTLTAGVWRDLKSLELRLRDPESGKIPLWVRWQESGNSFELCEVPGHTDGGGDAKRVKCGPAVAAGTALVLNAPLASLDVSHSKATGSGPTGPSVTLDMRVAFKLGAVKDTYDVEVAAETDAGLRDDFVPGGVLTIKR